MINRYLRFAAGLMVLALCSLLWVHTLSIAQLRRDIRTLNANNVNLIQLNEALSKGVGDVADKVIEKAEWDKKVAEKIRQLDSDVKDLYARTNQTLPSTVR